MTNRQKALGVTAYGYQRGIVDGEFLADYEAFKAKASTIKKGQHLGINIIRAWCPEYAEMDFFCIMKLEEAKRFFFGLTVNMPEHFYYTDTNGLDCLTVR